MKYERIGVYFLADDGVYEWVLGLLHSLRTIAPDVCVYCVPFSNKIDRVMRLEKRYRFSILNDPTYLNSSHTRAVLRTVGLAEKDGLPQRGCC
jgi:hypothetical protein